MSYWSDVKRGVQKHKEKESTRRSLERLERLNDNDPDYFDDDDDELVEGDQGFIPPGIWDEDL